VIRNIKSNLKRYLFVESELTCRRSAQKDSPPRSEKDRIKRSVPPSRPSSPNRLRSGSICRSVTYGSSARRPQRSRERKVTMALRAVPPVQPPHLADRGMAPGAVFRKPCTHRVFRFCGAAASPLGLLRLGVPQISARSPTKPMALFFAWGTLFGKKILQNQVTAPALLSSRTRRASYLRSNADYTRSRRPKRAAA
jgi:hypothetical protein